MIRLRWYWLLLVAACSSGPTVHVVNHDNGKPSRRGSIVDGLQQGEWQFFYPGGQLESTGSYLDDERCGQWRHWHSNGSRAMAGSYLGGRQVGVWEFWHENDQLSCRGEYRDGREHGEWRFFHDNGELQQSGCFAFGKRVLTWRAFDREGRLSSSGAYRGDRPTGIWRQRDADGNEQRIAYPDVDDTALVTETWDDGTVRREGFMHGGVPAGPWITRHPSGALRSLGDLVDGKPTGEWSTFVDEGELLARGVVEAGRTRGQWLLRGGEPGHDLIDSERPIPPWNGQWSPAALATTSSPLATTLIWIAEAASPPPTAGVVLSTDEPAPPASAAPVSVAPIPPLEAPTDPGQWTVREVAELELYRRYYRDGFLPRRASVGKSYGADASSGRLGAGDPEQSDELVGRRLPLTRFPGADGKDFDLDSLRGKKVLLVVLRGFTSQVCVYCFAQTAELAPFTTRLRELDCELVVLFPGSRSRFEAFRSACADEFGDDGPPYHMVYDPNLELTKGLRIDGNLARPSSLLLDRAGVVRHAYVAESIENVADRPPARRLLELVEALEQ